MNPQSDYSQLQSLTPRCKVYNPNSKELNHCSKLSWETGHIQIPLLHFHSRIYTRQLTTLSLLACNRIKITMKLKFWETPTYLRKSDNCRIDALDDTHKWQMSTRSQQKLDYLHKRIVRYWFNIWNINLKISIIRFNFAFLSWLQVKMPSRISL